MTTTTEFLDLLKASNGGCSDYALAKILGISKQAVSGYRRNKEFFSVELAIKVANLLKIDAGYVVACVNLERSKTDAEKQVWQGFAAIFPDPLSRTLCIMLSGIGIDRRRFSRLI